MRTHKDVVHCPNCGRDQPATVIDAVTPLEAVTLSPKDFRALGTVRCPRCGYWSFSPTRVSSDPARSQQ